MSDRRRQRLRTILTILVTVLVIAPAAALAGHQFTDVPNSNVFHDDIEWMRDNGVTAGCNPPVNDEYCPGDNVTREQMAAFMHRLDSENVFVRPGDDAVDGGNADTVDGMHASDFLGANEKAVDADKLDGKDASEFGPPSALVAQDSGESLSTCTSLTACADVVSLSLPAGSWLVQANLVIDNNDAAASSVSNRCGLVDASGLLHEARHALGPNTDVGQGESIGLSTVMIDVADGTTVGVRCTEGGGENLVTEDVVLTAIAVDA